MAIEIVSFPIKKGESFHSYVSYNQRVHQLSELTKCSTTGISSKGFSRSMESTGFEKLGLVSHLRSMVPHVFCWDLW